MGTSIGALLAGAQSAKNAEAQRLQQFNTRTPQQWMSLLPPSAMPQGGFAGGAGGLMNGVANDYRGNQIAGGGLLPQMPQQQQQMQQPFMPNGQFGAQALQLAQQPMVQHPMQGMRPAPQTQKVPGQWPGLLAPGGMPPSSIPYAPVKGFPQGLMRY